MLSLSATCLSIAVASKRGTLRLEEKASRLGGTYVAICDEQGIIEAALDMAEAQRRVADVEARIA
jgi:hypothetical protein